MTPLDRLIARQMGEQSRRLALAALAAAGVGAGAVVLLGLSGWFITGAALASGDRSYGRPLRGAGVEP
jgi:ATP-binding cassette subfamily C protein CydC